jgi:prepilin-type N-terminal cleavage/methylation domain-containing protein
MKLQPKSTTQTKKKKSGFTLIEVIAVLVLLGILAAIAVPRYIDMAENAKDRAIDAGIAEMNGREALTWGNQMIATGGYKNDEATFALIEPDLNNGGDDYEWTSGPDVGGGTLAFQEATGVKLTRIQSNRTQPAIWTRKKG